MKNCKLLKIALSVFVFIFIQNVLPAVAADLKITGFDSFESEVSATSKSEKKISDEPVKTKSDDSKLSIIKIKIMGEGFSPVPNENIVTIGNKLIPVILSDNTTIFSVLPSDIFPGKYQLIVEVNGQRASYDVEIKKTSGVAMKNLDDKDTRFITSTDISTELTQIITYWAQRRNINSSFQPWKKLKPQCSGFNSNNPLKITLLKLTRPNYPMKQTESSEADEYFRLIESEKDVTDITKGEDLALAIFVEGNRKLINNFEIGARFVDDNNNPINIGKEIIKTHKIGDADETSDCFQALLFTEFQFPYETQANKSKLNIWVKSFNNNKVVISESRQLSLLEPSNIEAYPIRLFGFTKSLFSDITSKGTYYYETSEKRNFLPGQYITFLNDFAIFGLKKGQKEEFECSFEIVKDGKISLSYLLTGEVEKNCYNVLCEKGVTLPDNITPGEYQLKSRIKLKNTNRTIESKPFDFTIDSYKPSIEAYTWIAEPINTEINVKKEAQRNILMYRALPVIRKDQRIAFVTYFTTAGFPVFKDKKHAIRYEIKIQDVRKNITATRGSKDINVREYENVNGDILLYLTAPPMPKDFVPGPISYTINLYIDDTLVSARNGAILK
ncbi:MAG: IPT/TIG domain-containing protein [Nitrospirae bacterium YQR-1]